MERGVDLLKAKCLVGGCNNLMFKGGYCPKHSKDVKIQEFLAERKKVYAEFYAALRERIEELDMKWPLARKLLAAYKTENKKFKEELEREDKQRRERIKSDRRRAGYRPLERFRQERKLLF
jgi:deoxyribodipyrimidine photolyase